MAPSRFGDAKEIADRLKDNRPVIVNLQMADRDLQRRMIDFCSGVTYALSGEMEKVADQVFLLAPHQRQGLGRRPSPPARGRPGERGPLSRSCTDNRHVVPTAPTAGGSDRHHAGSS